MKNLVNGITILSAVMLLCSCAHLNTLGRPTYTPAPPVAQAPMATQTQASFDVLRHDTVYFGFKESGVDSKAGKVIADVADTVKSCGHCRVSLGGFTDANGSKERNEALAKRRAEAVKQELIHNHVEAESIIVDFFGKDKLRTPTANGVKERSNRRVEIYVVE